MLRSGIQRGVSVLLKAGLPSQIQVSVYASTEHLGKCCAHAAALDTATQAVSMVNKATHIVHDGTYQKQC